MVTKLQLIKEFEKLVDQCAERGLATEMIRIEGIPNLRKRYGLYEHLSSH